MNNQTFTVSIDFIIDALQLRYDNVKELWGCDAAHELWEQALAMVEDCGIDNKVTSPSIFVDNYLINGEFVSKEDGKEYWLGCGYDELSQGEIDEEWLDYVTNNACLYNDNYACLSF